MTLHHKNHLNHSMNHSNVHSHSEIQGSGPKKIIPTKLVQKSGPPKIVPFKKAKPIMPLGYIIVKSKPAFSKVSINGRYMAMTPFKAAMGLAPGSYTLTIEKRGWQLFKEQIELRTPDTLVFIRELKPIP